MRRMRLHPVWIGLCLALSLVLPVTDAHAQDPPPIHIMGAAPEGPDDFFFVDFVVPEGIVEIEVEHASLPSGKSLDWGLDDTNGFRGWGGGKSENAIVGVQAASPAYIPGPIPAGTWQVVVGKPTGTPAEYEINILLRTEATLEPQPRTPYEDPGTLLDDARWYAGDLHVHTHHSDGPPSIRETLEFAREVGMEFIVLSEHNTNSGLSLYGSVQPDFPELLIVPGVEWTTYAGHANAFGAVDWVDFKVGVAGVTVEGAIDAYHDQAALFSPNHPKVPGAPVCVGCPWEYDVDPTTVDGIEVRGGIWPAIDYWEEMCANGSHATAVGGSDDHEAGQGSGGLYSPIGEPTTMVYAEELSVNGILEGIRSGRVVVKINSPDDPMLDTQLSGERIGHTVFADTATLSVLVTEGEGRTVRVIKNGAIVETVSVTSDPFTHEMNVEAPAEGEDRYRHQVMDGDKPLTIGSYVWLRAEESGAPDAGVPDGGTNPSDSSSGCSCRIASATDYDTALLLTALALGAWYSRRRRAR